MRRNGGLLVRKLVRKENEEWREPGWDLGTCAKVGERREVEVEGGIFLLELELPKRKANKTKIQLIQLTFHPLSTQQSW
jgi:hypothetical protein